MGQTLRAEIRERSAGLNPSSWEYRVFINRGGVERLLGSGVTDRVEQACAAAMSDLHTAAHAIRLEGRK